MRVKPQQYFRTFGSLKGLFAVVPFLVPLLRVCLPDSSKLAGYLYPPLGDFQRLGFACTIGALLLSMYFVYFFCEKARRVLPRAYIILIFGWFLGVCCLCALYVRYVRTISVPSIDQEFEVSVGFQKTEFALQWYPHSDDWEMLHDAGPYEEKIQQLWTQNSISTVRVLLLLSYTLTLVCFLSVPSLMVYEQAADEASRE